LTFTAENDTCLPASDFYGKQRKQFDDKTTRAEESDEVMEDEKHNNIDCHHSEDPCKAGS